LAILAVVLAIPPLLVIGIALGPITLLVVWGILVVSPFFLIGWASARIADRRWRHTHG
jgi:hypothetical protein